MISNDSIVEFAGFEEYGFKAGMSLKSSWADKSDIYDYINSNLDNNPKLVIPKQVHSSDILKIDKSNLPDKLDCDGLISNESGLCLTISTADCVPVILASDCRWYGAVHIGWRGFVGGITDNLETFGIKNRIEFSKLKISLGPSIGACCYDVGDEVAILFDKKHLNISEQNIKLDLKQAVVEKFISMGVCEENLTISEECTSCKTERFYSYRRDGKSPIQMVSYISKIK